ncbi:hypothetical protein [Rhizobium leguminosarum]|nr:hypothetical protein [Rhizobium leguminosarum]
MTDDELLALPGIGKRAVELIRASRSNGQSDGSPELTPRDSSGKMSGDG